MEARVKGMLITFEGSEGSGKSTQIELIRKYLQKSRRREVLFLREPGGVKISEKIRRVLLDVKNVKMVDECEMLLYMAARAQMVYEKVLPALKRGAIVLCDRFSDSTLAYQGYGNGMDIDFIKKVGRFVTKDVQPDLTLIFDIEAQKGLARLNRVKDRIEQRAIAYHKRVRKGYCELAKKEPKRVKIIKVNRTIEDVHEEVKGWIDKVVIN